ncbi:hypothetical protein PRK78_007316 [Emydomyces testavorans]|uniref:SprT-like domain-containing protein n=1 Tax=Emydomyces testavorans TaxID=2070801 RepID=A0AAF0DRT9_9EURO|nr:hypothetical protein PRK78_007316 [Emydomyces testavorans]
MQGYCPHCIRRRQDDRPPRDANHKEIIATVRGHYPHVGRDTVGMLLGVLRPVGKGLCMELVKAMAYLEREALREEFSPRQRIAVDTVRQKLGDREFQKLPVRIIVLAIFADLDALFFRSSLRHRVFIGKGDDLSPSVMGLTTVGKHVTIELSEKYFDDHLRHRKRRIGKLIEVLIHEMCHAYLPVVLPQPDGLELRDIDKYGRPAPGGHGNFFGMLMGFCQKILDRLGWNVDLSYGGKVLVIPLKGPTWSRISRG